MVIVHPSIKRNNYKKYVCLPYLKFSDLLPETHIFFLFGLRHLVHTVSFSCKNALETIGAEMNILCGDMEV